MNTFNQLLEAALEVALKAHKGQTDRLGMPYILHPLAVAEMVYGLEPKIVAILHDVIEDSSITLEQLRELGFSDNIVEAIDAITQREDEQYWTYLIRVKQNRLARMVKMADLQHNTSPDRAKGIPPKKAEIYQKAKEFLSDDE